MWSNGNGEGDGSDSGSGDGDDDTYETMEEWMENWPSSCQQLNNQDYYGEYGWVAYCVVVGLHYSRFLVWDSVSVAFHRIS